MTSPPFADFAGGGRRIVVFLHGIGGDHRVFEAEVARFAESAYTLAWDMPGYGRSAALESMTFPALADSLAELLDAHGSERAVLVGHSMGGMVAQEFAARHPERVEALALVATSPAFGSADGDWQRRFLADRLKPLDEGKTPADLARELVTGMLGDDPDPRGVARAVECMAAVPVKTYRAALHCLVTFDRRASLPTIRCPTLALAGERDRVAAPVVLERMARAIPGASYRVVAGAGHLVNLERPDAFARELAEFLGALPA